MSRVSPGNAIPRAGDGLLNFTLHVKLALAHVGTDSQKGEGVLAVMHQGRLFKIEISQLAGPQ